MLIHGVFSNEQLESKRLSFMEFLSRVWLEPILEHPDLGGTSLTGCMRRQARTV
jgi:hypothetical protein